MAGVLTLGAATTRTQSVTTWPHLLSVERRPVVVAAAAVVAAVAAVAVVVAVVFDDYDVAVVTAVEAAGVGVAFAAVVAAVVVAAVPENVLARCSLRSPAAFG